MHSLNFFKEANSYKLTGLKFGAKAFYMLLQERDGAQGGGKGKFNCIVAHGWSSDKLAERFESEFSWQIVEGF